MSQRRPSDGTDHLAREVKEGDLRSFEVLYVRVAPALRAWLALRIRPEQTRLFDAEDVMQELWFRALSIFDRFDPEVASFRSWILRVAKNVLLEALRHARVVDRGRISVGQTTHQRVLQICTQRGMSIVRRVSERADLAELIREVSTLTRDERDLFVLCGLEGASLETAARRLGISREAAKKRWFRLRQDIRSRCQVVRDVL